jgi:branched-chain amino acid transport system ATP-binding protein
VACRGIARSFQISAVFPNLTVRENLRVALLRSLGSSFHFWRPRRSLHVLDQRIAQLLELVDLQGTEELTAAVLPYGRRRALEIATTLALDPELLLLDEPMAGLAHGDVGRIADLIRRCAQTRTVLMVEHNLSVVADLSDTITVLTRGQVLTEGSYAAVSSNPEVVDAYLGTGVA